MRMYRCWLILFMIATGSRAGAGIPHLFTYRQGELAFEWDPRNDSARMLGPSGHSVIWQGSLLPSFWLQVNKRKEFVKATLANPAVSADQTMTLDLKIGSYGKGRLLVSKDDWGIRFSALEIEWTGPAPAIIEMYFGASDGVVKRSSVLPTWDRPFMPDWQSFGFCVPGAKGGTPQSYFRMWDFGQANIALGNFGPSMGSPYGAAYPRPLLYAGMGSDEGFVALGAGSIPDAAMSLRIQSTRGCFQYVYDENIWGALPGRKRTWTDPLRIALGRNAWAAFKNYYSSFPAKDPGSAVRPAPIWNTWGMWGQKKYLTRPLVDFAKDIGAHVLVMDDPWEAAQGAGRPDLERFPHFFEDIAYAWKKGVDIGVWETVGWIADPFAAGLKPEDLIRGRNGRPCKANWNFDPSGESYYCLDISSARAREFIRQRTIRIMETIKPAAIKLDFGYGLPSPSMGVPKDPRYRGERYAFELTNLIAGAARSINPKITIQYYSINPLWLANIDLVAMDDQGDLWYDVARGHQEWSIWGSLLSDKHIALCGSSGYNWEQDDEVVLNTCILGSPGAVLPIFDKEGLPVPDKYFNRRLAIDRWYRRPLSWTPLWLDSRIGDFTAPPKMNCWGRMEKCGKDSVLTALVLREGETGIYSADIRALQWKGRWALISQDDSSIFSTSRLAIIPFDEGRLSIPYPEKPAGITRLNRAGEAAYEDWEWRDGQLIITITRESLQNTAGFLVCRTMKVEGW